jgi:hypothetical protein
MAKRKDAIALFEAIQKSRQKRTETQMTVPQWMGRSPAGAPETAPAGAAVAPVSSADVAAPSAPVPPVGTVSPPPAGAGPGSASRTTLRALRTPSAAAPPGEPVVSLAGERLRLSLNYVSCAIAVGVLLVLLIGSFWLGWVGGKRSGQAVTAGGGDVPYKPGVAAGLGDREKAAAAAAAMANAPRQKGKFYLVVQSLAAAGEAERVEGTRICQYLEEQGHAARLATYKHPTTGAARYIVWSMKPFDSPGSDEAKAYARQVEDLGKTYFAKHKTYDFKQSAPGKKFDPWFELCK